jgi:acyl dehydratase
LWRARRPGRHDPGVTSAGGYAFEDLVPGRVFELGSTVVDRDEMLAFARRFDPQPFHVDEAAAAASLFGGLAASGWFTAALWMRLYADAVLAGSTSLGSPGGEDIAWPAPVFAGDELRGTAEVLGARRSASRPGLGLVRLRAGLHRGDVEVFRSVFTGMFGTRS